MRSWSADAIFGALQLLLETHYRTCEHMVASVFHEEEFTYVQLEVSR
jgi:hypothetical protein